MEIKERISSITNVTQIRDVITREKGFNNNSAKMAERDQETAQNQISEEETIEAVEILNDTMKLYNHKLHFEIHEDTQRMKVAVVDKITDEVIKEIPPEEMLDMLAKIQDMIGILLDKRI